MKRWFFVSVLLILFAGSLSWGDLDETVINTNTVTPARRLVTTLRTLIGDINAEMDEVKERGTGNVYYVDSAVGSTATGNSGLSPEYAKPTLDAAIGLCTADNGDIIYVMQGHSETMGAAADEVDIDVSGVTIIGLGDIDTAPLFDYTGDVTGAFAIGADDVTLINLRFHANVTDVNEAIEIESGSTGVSIINCIFDLETEGTDDFLECIDSVGGTADKLIVVGCQFRMGAGACNAAINTKDADYMYIAHNIAHGDYTVACIKNNTTASNHIVIADNILFNGTIGGAAGLNTEPAIELLATTTGVICRNMIGANLASTDAAIVGADCVIMDNWYSENEGSIQGAPMWITSDSTYNPIGYDDNDNSYASTNVAANVDGSILERLEAIQAGLGSDGTTVTDSATNTLSAIGVNDADNAFASNSVAANVDGSVLERLEHLLDILMDDETTNLIGVNDADNAAVTSTVAANADGSILERLEHLLDILMDDETTNLIGVNNADNAAVTSTVAANADGSILERLEHLLDILMDDETTNLIGVNDADNAAVTSTVAANADGSVLERLEYMQVLLDDAPRILVATGDLSTGWGTGDSPKDVFTVTGDALVRCFAVVSENCTSTSNTGTLELGVAGDTACVLLQDIVDATAFQANDCWTLDQAPDTPSAEMDTNWVLIPNGLDIEAVIGTNNMTDGTIKFYLQWIPLSADAAITSAL